MWNGLAVTGSFVLRRQLDPGPESMWFGAFIGCLNTASTQRSGGPVLTRINAIFTFKTNQYSKLQRGSKVCMNDKLLNQTDFLQIRKYLRYYCLAYIVWWTFQLLTFSSVASSVPLSSALRPSAVLSYHRDRNMLLLGPVNSAAVSHVSYSSYSGIYYQRQFSFILTVPVFHTLKLKHCSRVFFPCHCASPCFLGSKPRHLWPLLM